MELPQFQEYALSDLVKQIRIYEQTYNVCDDDRPIVKQEKLRLNKIDIDSLIREENPRVTVQFMNFMCNYIIYYCKTINSQPPYFILIDAKSDQEFKLENLELFDQNLSQQTFQQFKYQVQRDRIMILIRCSHWFAIYLDRDFHWAIDFKYTGTPSLDLIQGIITEFLKELNIELKLHDYMVELEQAGDGGDLIGYLLYKLFVVNHNIYEYDMLTKSEIQLSRRKILWLTLKMMKERESIDDDREFARKVEKQQKEMLEQIKKEQAEKVIQIKEKLKNNKQHVYGFMNQDPIIQKQPQDPLNEQYKQILAKFNVTRPVNKVEAYLTRRKATEQQHYEFKSIQPIHITRDPRSKVKIIVPQYLPAKAVSNSMGQGLQPQLLITPESMQITSMFTHDVNPLQNYIPVNQYPSYQRDRYQNDFTQSYSYEPVSVNQRQNIFTQVANQVVQQNHSELMRNRKN